ncbi:MAG: AraC family ligand binding domain-containing protein [Solidesulfovibrio sp.]|uniref:cupin domain-containing protein n=1 Tax=Solidesulfovibrio sp. TaxID=2910990 RepID=UPI002B20FFE7|nr:AraC family ligand binding domain-containing protein [Solidesulfovibrio sp.]MEA4858052.1 AraC family ligand binding domain-containing protein [Solidesulfovibrio sp.]
MSMENDSVSRFARSAHTPAGARDVAGLAWNAHPAFDGVALKHLLRGADTGGAISCHLVRVGPGKALSPHVHARLVVGLCQSGGRRIEAAGATWHVGPGEGFVIPAGLAHACSPLHPVGHDYLSLAIAPGLLPAPGPAAASLLPRVWRDAAVAARLSRLVAALAAGFCDQSHLTRQFRRRMGVSPGRFGCEGEEGKG